jgi:hypothetical protein
VIARRWESPIVADTPTELIRLANLRSSLVEDTGNK